MRSIVQRAPDVVVPCTESATEPRAEALTLVLMIVIDFLCPSVIRFALFASLLPLAVQWIVVVVVVYTDIIINTPSAAPK